ncbi:Allatostatin C, partial [Cryptotermes secundus]
FRMSSIKATKLVLVMLVAMLTLSWAVGKNLGQPGEKDRLISELDVSSVTDGAALSLGLEHFPLQTDHDSLLPQLIKSYITSTADNTRHVFQLVDDDGSIETALINYLFAKQVVNRLRSQMDVSDLQRKRSYWKQCAFNAVSCFGK